MSKQALNHLLGQMEQLDHITRRDHPEIAGSRSVELRRLLTELQGGFTR